MFAAMLMMLAQLSAPPPPAPHASAAVMPPAQSPPRPMIVEFTPGEVRCRGEVIAPRFAERPLPGSTFNGRAAPGPGYTLAFRIGADGRPLGISRPNRGEGEGPYLATDDLAPALAAWQFAPGERRGCTVTFMPALTPVATAPLAELARFVALPRLGSAGWREAVERVTREDTTCFTPTRPRVLLQGYPDFETIPQRPGTFSWTFVGYDIDRSGKAVRTRTLASDGNVKLDREAVAALARSRYVGEARTGCNFPFHRRQVAPLEPPPAPERDSFVAADARCDNSVNFAKKPVMTYPEGFRRRSIEGWAVVRYDVAPWGGTGNIAVLASEPAEAFGEEARRVIAAATRPPSSTGAAGCVDRVRFKLPADGRDANTTEPPVIVTAR